MKSAGGGGTYERLPFRKYGGIETGDLVTLSNGPKLGAKPVVEIDISRRVRGRPDTVVFMVNVGVKRDVFIFVPATDVTKTNPLSAKLQSRAL